MDSLLPGTLGRNERLERIGREIEWDGFDALVAGVYSAPEGRPSYPPLTMVKILLLQQWYTLSDTLMEEALDDRISFRRFVGLGLEDDTPDYSTISRFRTELARRGLAETLFHELGKQLEKRGLFVQGRDIDGRHAGGGAGQTPSDERRAWREEHAGPRCGLEPDGSRITDTLRIQGRISAWTQEPAWCAWRY